LWTAARLSKEWPKYHKIKIQIHSLKKTFFKEIVYTQKVCTSRRIEQVKRKDNFLTSQLIHTQIHKLIIWGFL
jgi:hypothetical protein